MKRQKVNINHKVSITRKERMSLKIYIESQGNNMEYPIALFHCTRQPR